MKRVVVNGFFLKQRVTGVQRYARETLTALQRLPLPFELVIAAPSGALIDPPRGVKLVQDKLPLPGLAWEQFRLPAQFRALGGDLLWSPANTGPLSVRNQAVAIMDASVFAGPQWFSGPFAAYYRWLLPQLGKRAARIITISESSKRDLARFGVAAEGKVDVVPCGVADAFRDRAPAAKEPYVLCVGSLDPRKNMRRLLASWERLPSQVKSTWTLKIVGGSGRAFAGEKLALPAGAERVGVVSDAELAELYAKAGLLVYPSFYEGFGLPPLEAMACGTAVLVSDIPPHREVCGEAAAYCNPLDELDIAEKLERLLAGESMRTSLREAGLRRAEAFTWDAAAAKLRDSLASALGLEAPREAVPA